MSGYLPNMFPVAMGASRDIFVHHPARVSRVSLPGAPGCEALHAGGTRQETSFERPFAHPWLADDLRLS